MARPTKEGLEYFPLDVDLDQDDKLVVPVAKFGMRGFGIIIKLMMEVYKNGYFYNWTEKEKFVFSSKINEDINFVLDVVDECIKWGFFNQKLYDQHQILTSKGFQKRYLLAANRRKDIDVRSDFSLVNGVIADNNSVNVSKNPVNVDIMHTETTQKKRKEKKLKESNNSSSRNKKPAYSEDDVYYQMALYFHNKIMEHAALNKVEHLVKNADLQKWADEFRKMIELDKRERIELKSIIDWCTADSFWSTNILSAKKLREKYSELGIKMKAGSSKSSTINRDARNKSILQQKMEEAKRLGQEGNIEAFGRDNGSLPEPGTDQ